LYEFNMFDSCNPTSNRSIVYTDLQPVVQPVVSCIRGFSVTWTFFARFHGWGATGEYRL